MDWELDPLKNWFIHHSVSLLHEATGGLRLIQKGNCFCITARYGVEIKAHGYLAVRTGPFFIPRYMFKQENNNLLTVTSPVLMRGTFGLGHQFVSSDRDSLDLYWT